jgi:hypothetical protein
MTLTRPIAFIDIESTGVDVVNDRIIEFGASILRPDGSRTPDTTCAGWTCRCSTKSFGVAE